MDFTELRHLAEQIETECGKAIIGKGEQIRLVLTSLFAGGHVLIDDIPGVGKMLKNVEINDDVFKQTEAIIHSMTPAERADPSIINGSRRQRIATGSGTTMQDVNRLLKQFEDTRKVMKSVAGGMPKMPKGFNPRGFKR